ncbi:AraC family transcriptional regulator [Paenibacillus filicis]|uniref:AraC family transcriptional regulator n=1 Tax=Paenibacillus gyeongsangnamensis TaxID=3388067 RepID=A0ABT4QCZ4_9BACL|nr:AraC family transcriptional regulator [Paenibacillus filicis]MCZ8514678.1 AraC family transcriptional regulator [Paenibacillus filicis]
MQDITGPKYHIDFESRGEVFSIQYLHRIGNIRMPRPHAHPYYEIFYLLQGERVYFIDDRIYTAQRGDMIVIHPNELHSTASSDVLQYERILIYFSEEFLTEGGIKLQLPVLPFEPGGFHRIKFSLKEQPVVEKLLRDMILECGEKQAGYLSYVQTLLQQVLIRAFRSIRQNAQEPAGYAHPMHEKISEIASYMNRHFEQDLTLEQVAKAFFISPSYLSRIFTRLTGFHFREYLQVIRIREAQRFLKETDEKIQTIAGNVGFGHIAHFNKTFKKMTGDSPLRYRKRNRMAEPAAQG